MMTRKKLFIEDILNQMHQMTALSDITEGMGREYLDNGYNSGGTNPINNADVSQYNILAINFHNAMNFYRQFRKLLNNQIPAPDDYRKVLNLIRRSRELV